MAGASDRTIQASRWTGRLVLGTLLVAGTAVGLQAHEDQLTCSVAHEEGLTSASGYLVGDTSYRVRSSFSPELGGAGRLSVDVFASAVDPKTGLLRGRYVPGLVGSYRLLGPLGGSLASGELELEMTPAGPAYRTTLPIEDDREDLELQLSFAGPSTGDEGRGDSQDADSLCFRLRATDVALGGDPGVGGGGDGGFTSWNTRLVGQLAPRGDRYADIWGYSDGTTHLAIIGTFQGTSFIDVTVAE